MTQLLASGEGAGNVAAGPQYRADAAAVAVSPAGRRVLRPGHRVPDLRNPGAVDYPNRDERVDLASGIWGIWMPGFMQFIAGTYIFLGPTLFGTFTSPSLYMTAVAFTAYGVHWFALG